MIDRLPLEILICGIAVGLMWILDYYLELTNNRKCISSKDLNTRNTIK